MEPVAEKFQTSLHCGVPVGFVAEPYLGTTGVMGGLGAMHICTVSWISQAVVPLQGVPLHHVPIAD